MRCFSNTIVYGILVGLMLCAPLSLLIAAEVSYVVSDTEVGIGDTVQIEVFVDTENVAVNAFEGTIVVPDIFAIQAAHDGNSHVTLWAERPTYTNNRVSFSGITPGGINHFAVRILTLELLAVAHGAGEIGASDFLVLAHDGEGTPVPLRETTSSILVSPTGVSEDQLQIDTEAPEPFTPVRTQDRNLENGRLVLLFATQDNNSGIAGYEVAFSDTKVTDESALSWEAAVSPFVLPSDADQQYVYVRATDNAGNIRISVLDPVAGHSRSYYLVPVVPAVILIFGLLWFIRRHRKQRTV